MKVKDGGYRIKRIGKGIEEAIMISISGSMSGDHRRCDDLFVRLEKLILAQKWADAKSSADDFEHSMENHFSVEEELLFPAIEQAAAQAVGPVRVMLMEHRQMRQLIAYLLDSIAANNKEEALGICETLLITMQQHNMKEENILYQMADRAVPDLGVEIAERIEERA